MKLLFWRKLSDLHSSISHKYVCISISICKIRVNTENKLFFLNLYGFEWHGFGGGAYRGEFCEKLPEGSPMSDDVSASQLQDSPTAGQG